MKSQSNLRAVIVSFSNVYCDHNQITAAVGCLSAVIQFASGWDPAAMGLVWSSPYHWQIIQSILQVILGLFILIIGFVLLLVSIGLDQVSWRILGVIFISLGTALSVFGTCWCVFAARWQTPEESLLYSPEAEAENLTNEEHEQAWTMAIKPEYVILRGINGILGLGMVIKISD